MHCVHDKVAPCGNERAFLCQTSRERLDHGRRVERLSRQVKTLQEDVAKEFPRRGARLTLYIECAHRDEPFARTNDRLCLWSEGSVPGNYGYDLDLLWQLAKGIE